MKKYFFYYKNDSNKEPVHSVDSESRLDAAKLFAKIKNLSLKSFLSLFNVSK
jgi:hypothetical protein